MFKRIIAVIMLLCLLIAVPLALLGIKRVELGEPFLALMHAVTKDLNNFKVEIPDIPLIDFGDKVGAGWDVIKAIASFFNFFIRIINVFILLINIVIQLFQVIFLVVRHLITFKDTLQSYQVPNIPVV